MLNLGVAERQLLGGSGALTTDHSGNEILAGLDETESQFVIDADRLGADTLPPTEREKYLALMIRHRGARILLSAKSITWVENSMNRDSE